VKRGPKPRRRRLFNVKLTDGELGSFREAAARVGMPVSTWVRFTCLGAALREALKGGAP